MKKTFVIILIIVAGIWSCSESISDAPITNNPPNSFISVFEDSGSTISQQKSRLVVNWWGDDPDGLLAGFYFKWVGYNENWQFTTSNDSLFSLPIGTVDTTFQFKVAAADDQGNGVYDQNVKIGDELIGSEPFNDLNGNGIYDSGEPFTDIGLVDPTPAVQGFPIKNTPPVVEWNELSVIPERSFPVMTVGWLANDLDGNESITNINIALNDTTEFVSLDGFTRIVTIRIADVDAAEPEMEILLNGDEKSIFAEKLKNLKLDDNNRIYIQATDISGAKSPFLALPDTSRNWFVEKPRGDLLIVDDDQKSSSAQGFYANAFDNINSGALIGKYNVMNLENTQLPYEGITFLQTLNLFDYVYWYADDEPNLELINSVTQRYVAAGNKIAFSMTFKDSSANFNFSLPVLQNFLPIDSLGQDRALTILQKDANLIAVNNLYPNLKTSSAVFYVRTFYPGESATSKVFEISGNQIQGNIAFIDNSKSLFFIGMPLHLCDGIEGSVSEVLKVLFFDEFGLTP